MRFVYVWMRLLLSYYQSPRYFISSQLMMSEEIYFNWHVLLNITKFLNFCISVYNFNIQNLLRRHTVSLVLRIISVSLQLSFLLQKMLLLPQIIIDKVWMKANKTLHLYSSLLEKINRFPNIFCNDSDLAQSAL